MNRDTTICKLTFRDTGWKDGTDALMLRGSINGLRISDLQSSITARN
jgi:hypothetical protein